MRMMTSAALAVMLMMGGVAMTASPGLAQKAQTKKKTKKPPSNFAIESAGLSEGGVLGCVDTSKSSRWSRAAESWGAKPCVRPRGDTPQTDSAALSSTWLIGTWARDTGACSADNRFRRIRANGTYETNDEIGTWRLGSDGVATFTPRPPMQPYRVNVRRAGEKMQLNVGWWQRCSRNPAAPLS